MGKSHAYHSGPYPGAERATSVRWRIVALLMAYAALCHLNRISMSVAGTEYIMRDYGIDTTRMGYVYSAYLLVYTICMIPGGWLIDRYGTKAALALMGFGSAVFVGLTGLTGLVLTAGLVFPALLVVRALLGAVTAPIHPGAARAVSLWVPPAARSWANGLVTGAALLGIALAYSAFGHLQDAVGWPRAFLVCGVLTAALAAVWTAYATDRPATHAGVNAAERRLIEGTDSPHTDTDVESEPWILLFSNRSLMLLTISYGAVNYFEYQFFFWMEYYFRTVLNLGKEDGRTYSTILTLAMAAGMFGGGWLTDALERRWGRRRGRALVPVAGLLASALFLWLGLLTRQTGAVVTCFSLAMLAVGTCEGPFWTTAVELGGRRGGAAAAICNTGGNAAGLLAPVVTPMVSDLLRLGWAAGFGLASYICVFGAVLWWWIKLPEPEKKLPSV
jgi:MFS family permease